MRLIQGTQQISTFAMCRTLGTWQRFFSISFPPIPKMYFSKVVLLKFEKTLIKSLNIGLNNMKYSFTLT